MKLLEILATLLAIYIIIAILALVWIYNIPDGTFDSE